MQPGTGLIIANLSRVDHIRDRVLMQTTRERVAEMATARKAITGGDQRSTRQGRKKRGML